MSNTRSIDEIKVAELFISGKMKLDELKSVFGISKTQVKAAVRNNTNEAVNHMISAAYDSLEITDPFVFNRKPQERPLNWSSKYTPTAIGRKGTKISMATEILRNAHSEGRLTRYNRASIVKEISKKLNLSNEMTAKTYFSDARRLANLEYTG